MCCRVERITNSRDDSALAIAFHMWPSGPHCSSKSPRVRSHVTHTCSSGGWPPESVELFFASFSRKKSRPTGLRRRRFFPPPPPPQPTPRNRNSQCRRNSRRERARRPGAKMSTLAMCSPAWSRFARKSPKGMFFDGSKPSLCLLPMKYSELF